MAAKWKKKTCGSRGFTDHCTVYLNHEMAMLSDYSIGSESMSLVLATLASCLNVYLSLFEFKVIFCEPTRSYLLLHDNIVSNLIAKTHVIVALFL